MKIIAKTFTGLEDILTKEIESIDGENIKKLNRSVEFEGDNRVLYLANYRLRTAIKILVPIFDFKFDSVEEFYQKLYDYQWDKIFDASYTFSIDTTVRSDFFNNTYFATLRTKDAIVDYFRKKTNIRPNIDKDDPDIKINLYVNNDYCNVSLDSSGKPLFKRGWRKYQGIAPMNEVLAAAIVMMSQWNTQLPLLDFMCGSGTIPIEAAMIAFNVPPQIKRQSFSFMKWREFDYSLWMSIVEEERSKINYDKDITIYANDSSYKAIENTKVNIRSAGLKDYIKVLNKSFDKLEFNKTMYIIFNPPYGKRIDTEEEIFDFYKKIGDTLKNNFKNCEAWMITGNMDALKHIGLRTSKRINLYNGQIEAKLVKYEIY